MLKVFLSEEGRLYHIENLLTDPLPHPVALVLRKKNLTRKSGFQKSPQYMKFGQ